MGSNQTGNDQVLNNWKSEATYWVLFTACILEFGGLGLGLNGGLRLVKDRRFRAPKKIKEEV